MTVDVEKLYTNQHKSYIKSLTHQLFGDELPDTTQYDYGDVIPLSLEYLMEQKSVLAEINSVHKAINNIHNDKITPTVALNKVLYNTSSNAWLKRPDHRDDILRLLQVHCESYRIINQMHAQAALRNSSNFSYNLGTDLQTLQNNVKMINHPSISFTFVQIKHHEIHPITRNVMTQMLMQYEEALKVRWYLNDHGIKTSLNTNSTLNN